MAGSIVKNNSKKLTQIVLIAGIWAISLSTHAQSLEEFCKSESNETITVTDLQSLHVLDSDTADSVKQFCQLGVGIKNRQPDVINKVIQPWLTPANGLAFLKDIDFKIKAFENDSDSGENGLGFSYDYSKIVPLNDYRYSESKNTTTGYSINFKANGNVAYNADINPADFLDTRFSFSGFRYRSGLGPNGAVVFAGDRAAIEAKRDRMDELEDVLATAQTQQELAELQAQQAELLGQIRNRLGKRSYVELDLNVGLESDQSFDQTQWSYGAQVALDYKSYDRDAWQSQFNIFDWPFAVIRMFTGYNPNDNGFEPYGSTIPTIVLGYDQVDPTDNLAREALGETSKFDRLRAEAFFRTPIAFIGQSEIWFNADWRLYKESGASDVIEAAGLDEFNYRTISISSANGLFVSYLKGTLPFDIEDTRAYEVGWKFNFGQL